MKKILPLAAVVAVAGMGSWYFSPSNTGSDAQVTNFGFGISAANAQETSGDVDTSAIVEMTLGAEDAPVTIVEYASYTCPHCASFHEGTFKQLKSDYIDTGKVKFVYREVFFDRYGLWASMVARCGGTEKFFGITDLIYSGQSEWTRAGDPNLIAEELRKIGRIAGIESETLETCLSDGTKAQSLVTWYEENAKADGVRSTPSFVIDGDLHSNMSYADFQKILDEKIDG